VLGQWKFSQQISPNFWVVKSFARSQTDTDLGIDIDTDNDLTYNCELIFRIHHADSDGNIDSVISFS